MTTEFSEVRNVRDGAPLVHELKTWPEYFQAVKLGRKTFEFRDAMDRDFCVGDVLRLQEWSPLTKQYSGDSLDVVVTYILRAYATHYIMAIEQRYADESGNVWTPPTAEAYAKVCAANNVRIERIAELEKVKTLLIQTTYEYVANERDALLKDKERLDWLENHEDRVNQIEPPSCFPDRLWTIYPDTDTSSWRGKTLRDVIDAATKAVKETA